MAKDTDTLRLATVTATGRRYIVNFIDFNGARGRGVVHCWGEVVKVRPKTRRGQFVGMVRVHGEAKKFVLDKVEISEVPNTNELSESLFWEAIDALEAEGHSIRKSRSGRRVHVGPKDPEHAIKQLARELGYNWYLLSTEDRAALEELVAAA